MDARLDDRPALLRELGLTAEADDATLLAAGWRRWGTGLASRLRGDFAFAIHDDERDEVYAARDALGVRPLAYRSTASGWHAGPDPASLAPEAPLDERSILRFLLDEPLPVADTFFAGVHRLPGGHHLHVRAGAPRLERWFVPPSETPVRDPAGEIRDRLTQAVRLRAGGGPIVARVSGGLDSSAIACLAAGLDPRPDLRLVTAAFPGLDCDETGFAAAVARHTGFPAERYDGTAPPGDPEALHPSSPETWHQSAIAGGWLPLARAAGARAALSGVGADERVGADELFFEVGIFRDLAAHLDWGRLLAEAARAPRTSTRSTRAILLGAAAALLPRRLRVLGRRLRRSEPRPTWLAPRLRRLELPPPEAPLDLGSHTASATWAWLTGAALADTLELEHRAAGAAGVELRYPYLDAELVRFVLALPWRERLPRGRMKRLLRDAVAGVLPPEVAARDRPTGFDEAFIGQVRQRLPFVETLLGERDLHTEAYIDPPAARGLIEAFRARPDWPTGRALWNIASLELWLRRRASSPAPARR